MRNRYAWQIIIADAVYSVERGDSEKLETLLDEVVALQESHPTKRAACTCACREDTPSYRHLSYCPLYRAPRR